MLNQGKVTEKQQSEFEKRRQEKADHILSEQQKTEQLRAEDHKKKEDDFDAFTSGKITDDMTLQDIFKSYYGKAKSVDVSAAKDKVSNSAMNSLGGFSQRLEERRRKAKEAKEAKEAEAKAAADKFSVKGKREEKAAEEAQQKMKAEAKSGEKESEAQQKEEQKKEATFKADAEEATSEEKTEENKGPATSSRAKDEPKFSFYSKMEAWETN